LPGYAGQKAAGCTALVAALSLLAGSAGADPPSSSNSPAGQPANRAASKDPGSLPQITIEAQRQDTEKRVHEFVSHAPVLVNYESLARWNRPICPMVAGLPRSNGEFVLTRLSEVATAVGAPLAPPGCSNVNLVIIVASNPVALLKAWAARVHYRNLFGDAGLTAINRFLKTPRAIRVWYNHQSMGADGSTITPELMPGLSVSAGANSEGQKEERVQDATRLERSEVWGIYSVIELVDSGRMRGFKYEQMADYVATAGLAEFNFDADFGTAPTILRLFDAPGEAGTSNAWDEAFLKALYHTSQSSTLQTSRIIQSMAREITR
jgi:hypothetical protein